MASPHDVFGPVTQFSREREIFWREHRQACWRRFQSAAELLLREPRRTVRRQLLADYALRHGEIATRTLVGWVEFQWQKLRDKHA